MQLKFFGKIIISWQAQLLGPGLVYIEKTEASTFLKPVTVLPNVLELMYYSNTLSAHFCTEGVVGKLPSAYAFYLLINESIC